MAFKTHCDSLLFCKVSTKISGDKDEKRREDGKFNDSKKSDTWAHKKYYSIIGISTSFWAGLKNKETWSGIF